MDAVIKKNPIQVLVTDDEKRVLERLVRKAKRDRRDSRIGAGTLLREFALPHLDAAKAGVAE